MISFLKGTVHTISDRFVILVIDDSVGYGVSVTNHLIESLSIGETIALFVYTHVREDALELYGFKTQEELDFFQRLISIPNVGPKTALGVLSVAPLADIKKAIIHGDPALLQQVGSVGKKTAERIIVELREKITVSVQEEASGMNITENIQLREALTSLGYRETEIRQVIPEIPVDVKDLSDKIKEALRLLSKPAV